MSDETNDLGQFREFEHGVRRGLVMKADGIQPNERLGAILAAGEPKRRSPLWIVAAAAVFVLVAALGIGYLLRNNVVASTSTAAGAQAQQDRVTASDQPAEKSAVTPAAGVPSTAPNGALWAMPVYSVVSGTSTQPWLVTRTFVSVPDAGDRTKRVEAAIAATLSGTADGKALVLYNAQHPWRAGTTATVTVTDTLITVSLNQPGTLGLVATQQRIAVQSLVWTATAAAQLTVPVRVQLATGGGVFATVPAGNYSRPATAYTDLVPIWIDSPAAGATVASPVKVSGQACVFEAQFSWEVLQGTTVVASGNAMASTGCPDRGDYSFTTGTLAPGTYTIRVWEVSMKDGGVQYETRVPITVA